MTTIDKNQQFYSVYDARLACYRIYDLATHTHVACTLHAHSSIEAVQLAENTMRRNLPGSYDDLSNIPGFTEN